MTKIGMVYITIQRVTMGVISINLVNVKCSCQEKINYTCKSQSGITICYWVFFLNISILFYTDTHEITKASSACPRTKYVTLHNILRTLVTFSYDYVLTRYLKIVVNTKKLIGYTTNKNIIL